MEKRTRARPDCGGASADFLEARPPARHLDCRQHVAFALGRDRQRPPGVQKVEEAIFQRAPFVLVKLGMAELRLVEKRQTVGISTSGLWKTLPAKSICVLPLAIVILSAPRPDRPRSSRNAPRKRCRIFSCRWCRNSSAPADPVCRSRISKSLSRHRRRRVPRTDRNRIQRQQFQAALDTSTWRASPNAFSRTS